MNSLLVDKKDGLKLGTTYKILFQFTGENIHSYISLEIIPQILKYDIDIIFIKDSLSDNYLELYGIILAYHIRLSQELENIRSLPIVILSDLDSCILNKISPMANILFTKNVFLEQYSKNRISKYQSPKRLSSLEYKEKFLDLIEIKIPIDYTNNHSFTNEWAIYQWSKVLGVSTHLINKKIDHLSNMLYFKYLKSKYNLQDKTKHDGIKKINLHGKVLLIDDKWDDGWKVVIDEFLSKHYDAVFCDALEWTEKDATTKDLKSLISEKIISYDPDIILLDLRLLQNEENTAQISKISGIQILKHLREECKESINQGIQIIIFSASGDSLIVEEAGKYGTMGYVKKDSPINKYVATKGSFSKLDQLIKDGIKRKYLKKIWKTRQLILLLPQIKNAKAREDDQPNEIFEIKNNITYVFEILNSNLPQPNLYAMYAIFKCLELIIDSYIYEKKDKYPYIAVWKESNKEVEGYNSTENKIKKIMEQRLNIVDNALNDEIKKIVCCRNYSIHGGEKPNCKDITIKQPNETHILKWFEMLLTLLAQADKVAK